tara:strand:+ start:56 stop:955 length:900 start_codon:yes stop_codon:yes gene_type:complete
MTKSTFAGKSTDDTIRNYAEMLIDDLNSNLPDNAGKHWDKAREIDNKLAKEIFTGEYSERIGEAYFQCITKFRQPELLEKWDFYWSQEFTSDNPMDAVTFAAIQKYFDECIAIGNTGELIAPNSIELNLAIVWLCLTNMTQGTLELNRVWKNGSSMATQREKSGMPFSHTLKLTRLPLYTQVSLIANLHITNVLKINSQHPKALEYQDLLGKLDAYEDKLSCFIATAAYGTPFAEDIDVLRNWRDDFLEASYPGRAFIKAYYSLSPPVADNISESEGKRKIVRTALGPIVKILKDKYSD